MASHADSTIHSGTSTVKERRGIKVKEARIRSKSINRSDELDQLTVEYTKLRQMLRNLILALKNHHSSMLRFALTRVEVADSIASLAEDSPLATIAGLSNNSVNQVPASGEYHNKMKEQKDYSKHVSYKLIHDDFALRTKACATQYEDYIIDYAVEWEVSLKNRVSSGIDVAETLRRNLDHYQKKVNSMQHGMHQTLAKGRTLDLKNADKLTRNEKKMVISQEKYNRYVHDMCELLEEMTERSWKDLHPMLVKIVHFDRTMSRNEARTLTCINDLIREMGCIARKHTGISSKGRIKDIEEQKASRLYTDKETKIGPVNFSSGRTATNTTSTCSKDGGDTIHSAPVTAE